MNRWLVPGLTVVTVGATVALTMTVLPAATPPPASVPTINTRVTVVCPAFESATATVRVAATALADELRTAPLAEPDQAAEAAGVTVLTDQAQPVLVSAAGTSTFGAISLVRGSSGADRGLSATACEAPATARWFAGVLLTPDAQADLVLANSDTIDAAVDITIFGPEGRINAPGSRGIVVEPGTARSVPLSVLTTVDAPVTLLVESSAGRVSATLRQRLWQDTTVLGSDWIAPTQAPDTELVLPGVAAGEGTRELVVTNPGERTTAVSVESLGDSGRGALTGLDRLDLPANTTQSFDLGPGTAGEPIALRLESEQPIVAGIRQSSSEDAEKQDPAWASAVPAIGADGLWPVPAGAKATVRLLLANPGQADAELAVTLGDQQDMSGATLRQIVPAGSTVAVEIPGAATSWVRVQAAETSVRGALEITERLGGIDALTIVPLVTPRGADFEAPPVRFDPHAGR